jgi:hypothetical protein
VDGCWCRDELAWAEANGATIHAIHAALVYPSEGPLYRPFIDALYSERQRAKADGDAVWDRVIKLWMNSLSGKLAERPERRDYAIHQPMSGPLRAHEESGGTVGAWMPIDRACKHWQRETHQIPRNGRPSQAAVITAHTHTTLGTRLLRQGDGLIYCDTDSCYAAEYDSTDVDATELGRFGYEGPLGQWSGLAPKMFCYWSDAHQAYQVKAKGIPGATVDDFEILAKRGRLPDGTMPSIHAKNPAEQAAAKSLLVKKVRGVESSKLRVRAHDIDPRFFVRKEVNRTLRRPACVAGTRYALPDGSTIPLHREKDGAYVWPGIDASPYDYLPQLTPEK